MLWLLLMAPGFLLAYSAANLYAAHLPPSQVHEISMSWERFIPFLPWTILLYVSIDLLYVASAFLCRTRHELRAQPPASPWRPRSRCCASWRSPCASARRPAVDGIPRLLFDLLGVVDRPYNQAPSLHISLLVILWARYMRHCPARWTSLLNLASVCIAVSVLTTWQHHFFDVPTGFAVGLFACRVIAMDPTPRGGATQPT
jgi:hypothetical protein